MTFVTRRCWFLYSFYLGLLNNIPHDVSLEGVTIWIVCHLPPEPTAWNVLSMMVLYGMILHTRNGNGPDSARSIHTPTLLWIIVRLFFSVRLHSESDYKYSKFALTRTLGLPTESDAESAFYQTLSL